MNVAANRGAVIHYRDPLGRILCGRRPAGGSQGEAGNNHVDDRTTCKGCLERLAQRDARQGRR